MFLKNNLANFVTFIGFIASFFLLVLLWEVVSIYSSTGMASWSVETSWMIMGLAILAVLTDWADGKIARSKRGKITLFGETSDKVRDKILIAFLFVNMIRSLRAVPCPDSFFYVLVRFNIAMTISALAIELCLFILGSVGIAHNLITGMGKFATSPTQAGKNKMALGCFIGLLWLSAFLFHNRSDEGMESYEFMLSLFVLLIILNFLAGQSIHGYISRINSRS